MADDSTSDPNDNLRKNKCMEELETYVECTICNTGFSDEVHYNRHLGTKKHKRNKREKEFDRGDSPNQTGDNYIEDRESCYKGEREKYKQENFVNFRSNYTSYVWSVTAYWASVLVINPTVKDFKISLFDKDWGNFGHAVIEIEFIENGREASVKKIFAIHFKHLFNNITNMDVFNTDQFNFQDIISQIARIKARYNRDDVKFVVYTTAAISPELNLDVPVCMQVKLSCKYNNDQDSGQQISNIQEGPVYIKALGARTKSIIDTSDYTQTVYYFYSQTKDSVLPNIYIHTSQKWISYFPSSITELFFTVLKEERVQLFQELVKFVENWRMGRHWGTYKLKKEDVLEKLGELLLCKFIVTPKVKYSDPPRLFDIWLQAVDTTHVTVLKDPVNLSEICEPMNLLIEKELGVHIDITSQTVKFLTTKEQNDIVQIQSNLLKAYIFEETVRNSNAHYVRISMEKIYLIFWKLGLTHLILEVSTLEDREYVLRVINWLKSVGLNRRYFLKTSDVNIKTFVKTFENLSFFVSLDDVVEKLDPSMLDQVKIYVTDEFSLNLKTIRESDIFFQKHISANEFFDMTLGKYFWKPCGDGLIKGRADELKMILSEVLLKTLRSQVQSKNNRVRHESNAQNHRLRGINPKLFE